MYVAVSKTSKIKTITNRSWKVGTWTIMCPFLWVWGADTETILWEVMGEDLCSQVLGLLFKNEVKDHTDCRAARGLYSRQIQCKRTVLPSEENSPPKWGQPRLQVTSPGCSLCSSKGGDDCWFEYVSILNHRLGLYNHFPAVYVTSQGASDFNNMHNQSYTSILW